jgi:hypothetical protein
MMGSMTSTLSLTRLQKYSLFQKYSARSATSGSVNLVFIAQPRETYLKVWAGDRFCQLVEKRLLHLCKFCGIHDFEDVFDLV